MKRRILSALLALVMILSLVPAQVFAVATDDAVEAPAQEIVSLEETEPIQEEPVQEEPVQEEPVQEEPVQEEPVQEEPVQEEPVQEEPVQEEPVQEEPVQEEPVQEEPVQEEPVQEESVQEVQSAEVPAPVMKNVAAIADPTYTVTFDANDANGNALRYVEIQIVDSNGETVDHVETGYRGTATYGLPSGTYTAIVSYTSGNYAYYAEEDFTVADAAKTVVLTVRSDYSTSAAESTYNRTTYFNHVDIRVKGTYTTGTTVDLTTYNIRLANVKIVVTNPSSYSRYNFSQTFTNNSETYEWRKTGVRVYKGASVALTCDIYDSVTGDILKSGFTHTFYDGTHNGTNYGNTEFVKAIKQCDMHQGLDFIIDPQEIIEAVFLTVSHEWHVVDAEGNVIGDLPEGLANLPATREDAYESGDDHTVDTHHVEGHYVIDEENGKLYTFEGWDWWSHESDDNLKENTIGSDQTTVTVTDDTVIYGVWTVTDLELADSHITITKKFQDAEGNEVTAPADFHMLLTGPQGGSMEIALSQFTYANGVYSFELPVYTEGEYTLEEHAYTKDGFTTAASVTVKESATAASSGHDHITAGEGSASADSATFTLDIDYDTGSACAHVGEVNFVNTYAKSLGNDVHNYPNLAVNKLDADDRTILEGATFVLYKNYTNGQFSDEVATGTSDESGYVYFRNLEPGTYYLTETEAPEGYLVGFALYRVSVTLKDGFPKEILMDGAWCPYYEYDMSVDYSLDDGATWSASQHFSLGTTGNRFRLAAFNEKVTGQLTINKTFSGLDAEDIPVSVTVTVAYPDGSTTNHVLSAANNWTVTLTGLELGTYVVSETAPKVNGYAVTGVTYNGAASGEILIDEDDIPADYDRGEPVAEVSVAVRNTYDKKEADYYVWPDLNVLKVRDANGQPLSGAVFSLSFIKDSASSFYRSGTTNAAGKLVFTDIGKEYEPDAAPQVGDVIASFHFYEYQAPAGYEGMDGVYDVDLVVKSITEMENPHTDGVFYTVYETELKITDAYTNEPVELTDGELVVKNTKNVGDLTVQKTFGVHNAYIPASITATVTGPNGYSNTVTLNAANNWTVTLKNVPLGTYTVTEPETVTNIDGHPLYSADSTTQVTVTLSSGVDSGVDLSKGTAVLKNTYTREVINPAAFQVKKVDSVTGAIITTGAEFTLYSDSACTQVVQVENTGADGIATFYGFTDAATYYLKETAAPENYQLSMDVWEVTVSLKDGDPVIKVNEKTNIWESIYNWIAGSSHSDWANGVLTVENVKKTAYIAIHKNVIDTEKYYEGAEYSFTFDASDDAFDTQFTLKAGEHKNIENVPYGITYTITEDTTGAAYTVSVEDSGNGKVERDFIAVTFINTYEYQILRPVLNLLKVDADTNAPIQNAVFYLYGDPECTEYISGAVSDAEGKVEIPLPNALYYSTYYLKEMTPAEGYYPNETVYVVNAETVYTVQNAGTDEAYTEKNQVFTIDALNQSGEAYVVENTAIKPVKITVTKEWDDGGYHARPQEVIVTLYKDGGAYETKILNEDNGWTHTWEGPEFTDQYTWTVDEADVHVPEGYTKSVSADSNADPLVYDYTVTNTRAPKPVEITVTKTWEHNNGKTLPEFVNVTLYKDGAVYETVTLNEESGWTHTWTGLTDVHVWSVDEVDVPVGYEKEVSVDGYSFTITNTRIIQPITVTVEKVWKDGSSDDRPKSVEVVLYRNGEVYETVTLNEDNDWSYSWDLTDAYDWTVDEASVPKGYKKTVSHDGNDWTITNTLKKIPKTGDDARLLSLQIMCVVGLAGVAMCAYLLITPRKKEEQQ